MSNQARHVPDDRSAQVVTLLNQLGDRLQKSERERQILIAAINSLETRSDQSERIFLTLQDKLSKKDTTEIGILRRQAELEKLWQETLDRLNHAESIAKRMETALEAQVSLARRLEQAAQDKARMLRKIERIEESVEQTREAIRTGALVPAGGAASGASRSIFVAEPTNQNAKWWQRAIRVNTTALVGVLAVSILTGYGLSQWSRWQTQFGADALVASSPVAETGAAQEPARTADALGRDPFRAGLDTTPDALSRYAAEQPAADLSDTPVADVNTEDLLAAMETDPDSVAMALNTIEPGAIPPADAPVIDASVTPSMDAGEIMVDTATPVETTPPDAAQTTETPGVIETASVQPDAQTTRQTAPPVENSDSENFIQSERSGLAPIRDRMKPDAGLPDVIKQVEGKAFDGLAEAQHDLAAIYTAGHGGVKVDYTRAAFWFGEAAAQGVANARYNLGVLYHQGLGVKKDVAKAISWYRAAAQLGHPEAQYNLGIAHIEGIGTEYNPRLASQFFEQAANSGITEAAYNLGLIYENGLLGSVDASSALYWYKNAADRGSPEAQVALDQLSRSLNMDKKQLAKLYEDMNRDRDPSASAPPEPLAAPEEGSTPPPAEKRTEIGIPSVTKTASRAEPADIARAIPRLAPAEENELLGETSVNRGQTVMAQIQEQLMRRGLYPGPADGIGGPLTNDAIRSYQRQNGIVMDGQASEDLLARLLNDGDVTDATLAGGR